MTPRDKAVLDEKDFIRQRLYGGGTSRLQRYAALVLAKPSPWALLKYEILTTLLAPIPGLLGIGLRSVLWRSLFPRIGRGVVFGCRVTIRHPENIYLGDGVLLDDDVLIDGRGAADDGVVLGERVIVNRGAAIQSKVGGITIGADTNVGSLGRIVSQSPIHIGENVSLAGGVVVAGGRYAVGLTGETESEKQRFTHGAIRIGRNVRVGINSIIQDGVTIGDGAIVASASVVMSDVAPLTTVSGNPAREWRPRRPTQPRPAEPPAASTAATTVTSAPLDDLRRQIRAYLETTRFASFDEDTLTDQTSLFDSDVLDSLTLLDLLGWLEQTFEVAADPDEVLPENFDSVERIARFVARKQALATGAP